MMTAKPYINSRNITLTAVYTPMAKALCPRNGPRVLALPAIR